MKEYDTILYLKKLYRRGPDCPILSNPIVGNNVFFQMVPKTHINPCQYCGIDCVSMKMEQHVKADHKDHWLRLDLEEMCEEGTKIVEYIG